MPVVYEIVGLRLDQANQIVIVDLLAPAGDTAQVRIPVGNPAIAQLTIGRQVNAVFTAV